MEARSPASSKPSKIPLLPPLHALPELVLCNEGKEKKNKKDQGSRRGGSHVAGRGQLGQAVRVGWQRETEEAIIKGKNIEFPEKQNWRQPWKDRTSSIIPTMWQ